MSAARTVGILTDQIERMRRAGQGRYTAALTLYRDVLLAQLGMTAEQFAASAKRARGTCTARQAAAAFPHFGAST